MVATLTRLKPASPHGWKQMLNGGRGGGDSDEIETKGFVTNKKGLGKVEEVVATLTRLKHDLANDR